MRQKNGRRKKVGGGGSDIAAPLFSPPLPSSSSLNDNDGDDYDKSIDKQSDRRSKSASTHRLLAEEKAVKEAIN